jgi:hypothetical protein
MNTEYEPNIANTNLTIRSLPRLLFRFKAYSIRRIINCILKTRKKPPVFSTSKIASFSFLAKFNESMRLYELRIELNFFLFRVSECRPLGHLSYSTMLTPLNVIKLPRRAFHCCGPRSLNFLCSCAGYEHRKFSDLGCGLFGH